MNLMGESFKLIFSLTRDLMRDLLGVKNQVEEFKEKTLTPFRADPGIDGIGLLLVFLVGWMFFSIIYHVWG